MNTFYKLFVVKRSRDTCILLYGYGLPDTNELRGWSNGLINKKLNLYRLTCVMDDENSLKFQMSLTNKENIELIKGFSIKGGFIQRPETIMYPCNELNNSESLLKSLSKVKEYWNLEKTLILQELQNFYKNKEPRIQREKIYDSIAKVSQEVSISFFNAASERLGNIEIYTPSEWADKFECEAKKIVNKRASDISVKGIRVNKKENIKFDSLVNCVLSNSNRCVLNQIKEMKIKDDFVEFDANEDVSEIKIDIWNKESGELVYSSHETLMRQAICSMNIGNNKKYLLHDEWTHKLEKTFGGSKEKIEKLNEIRNIKYNEIPMVSKIGDYKNDPWNEAGSLSQRLVKPYRYENTKGAFCKKIGEGECEIDSFRKIAEYLNQPRVEKVIIVDPYFSIKAMEKFLGRVENRKLRLEIITSLSDIDPDKEGKDAKNSNYLNEVKAFLKRNNTIIHQYLKIINVTQNKNTAIHDRYLLRLLDDGTMDGYLLSNSLNSAGQNYSFVISPMDKEVTYSVIEYVNEIKDVEVQKQRKSGRFQIENLWDTFDKKYEKDVVSIVPTKNWEQYMITNYSNGEVLEFEELFNKDWDTTDEKAKESILKLCWYLYHRNDEKIMDSLKQFINNVIDSNKLLSLCNEIALQLEKEEELYEENNLNNRRTDVYAFRNALDKQKQESVKINPQYLLNDCRYMYYEVNGYVSYLYEIIYEIGHKELVNIMEISHSPKAMELLCEKMIFNCDLDFDIYNRLLMSDIEWLKEWAYYYFDSIIIRSIENLGDINHQIYNNIANETAIYQYASCIETISFEIDRISRDSRCNLDNLSKFNNELKHCVKEEAKLINKEVTFGNEIFLKLLNGPNERINCENYYLLLKELSNKKYKNMFLDKLIEILYQKWDKDEQFFEPCDYYVTYYAAYACLEYWNNDVETIFKELRINNKRLHVATEPGKYDMNYKEWNKSVQKVLWQLLFLKYYKELLEEQKMIDDENYNKIIVKITELRVIRNQCDRWHNTTGLVTKVFE